MFNGSEWEAPKRSVEFEIEATLNTAYHHGRRARIEDYLLLLINRKTNYPLLLSEGKTEKLELLINEVASAIEIPPIEPIIEVVGNKIKITNGIDGVIMAGEELDRRIKDSYANLNHKEIVIPTQVVRRELSLDELAQLKTKAETLIGKDLIMTQDDERIKLNGKELIILLSQAAIVEYVDGLSDSLNREPQDARFEFSDGKVKEFAPGRDGVEVNLQFTIYNLQNGIQKLLDGESKSETVEIVVTRTPPKVTTDKVNELGIRERIGRGESYYQYSIPNRIYNVALASSRLNSALIAPGEEFSFNKIVGEISGATGYREAYVISAGRTILGDGGGVCQVSTTLFRAAIVAGLPITERWAHAYRV